MMAAMEEIEQPLFDTHNHIHLSTADTSVVGACGVRQQCVLGTQQSDWEPLSALRASFPQSIRVGYGVHPWHAHRVTAGWLDELRSRLLTDPSAVVGEFGLDHKAKAPETGVCEEEAQDGVFAKQWDMACELKRIASVHVVGAHGAFLAHCRAADDFPVAVAMHSFGGSKEIAADLMRTRKWGPRFYFGFSSAINRGRRNARAVIASLPRDRVLVETDIEVASSVRECLEDVIGTVAEEWGEPRGRTAQIVHDNAVRFFTNQTTQ